MKHGRSRKLTGGARVAAAIAAAILIARGLVAGEAATLWGGGTSSNMASPATGLPADLSKSEPLWSLRLGSHQYTIPTVDRGRIYIGTDDVGMERPGLKPTGGGVLSCVDQATGKLLWRLWSPRFFEGVVDPYHFDQWKCGICSGPVVEGDRIYLVGNRGEVLCVDRQGQANGNDGPFVEELEYMGVKGAGLGPGDGDIVWRYDMLKDLGVVCHDVCGSTILLHGDLVYACTSNGIDGSHRTIPRPDAPSLIALDKRTGRLVATDGELIGRRMLHGHWSSPCAGVVGGRTLIFFGGGDGVLYAFEPPDPSAPGVQTLRRAWATDANPPEYRTRDGKLLPYSRHDRNTPDGPSEIIGTPVFHEGRVYVTIGQSPLHGVGRGCLTCVDAATGKPVWASRLVERSLATPAVARGLVFVPDSSGRLHCLDASTGERLWVHELEAGAWCASAFAADGKVYASTEANTLWILAAERERRVLSSMDLESMPITPTAVDGILYLPTQKRLVAYPGASPEAGSRAAEGASAPGASSVRAAEAPAAGS